MQDTQGRKDAARQAGGRAVRPPLRADRARRHGARRHVGRQRARRLRHRRSGQALVVAGIAMTVAVLVLGRAHHARCPTSSGCSSNEARSARCRAARRSGPAPRCCWPSCAGSSAGRSLAGSASARTRPAPAGAPRRRQRRPAVGVVVPRGHRSARVIASAARWPASPASTSPSPSASSASTPTPTPPPSASASSAGRASAAVGGAAATVVAWHPRPSSGSSSSLGGAALGFLARRAAARRALGGDGSGASSSSCRSSPSSSACCSRPATRSAPRSTASPTRGAGAVGQDLRRVADRIRQGSVRGRRPAGVGGARRGRRASSASSPCWPSTARPATSAG